MARAAPRRGGSRASARSVRSLWTQSIAGNFYYLAHVEAILFTFVALIEWRGRRRPWLIGLALGLAALARPTVLLAAIPFGVAFLRDGRDRWRHVAGFAAPLALAVGRHGALRRGPLRLAVRDRLRHLGPRPGRS